MVYLSYDGALDPLGSSQVLPVVKGLAGRGEQMTLVSFEKRSRWLDRGAQEETAARLEHAGVRWRPLRYHKRFSLAATSWDLFRALVVVVSWRVGGKVDLLHARSYPPALVAWLTRRICALPYVFDMRGLYVDERIEAGIWPEGSLRHRAGKRLEKLLLRDAAAVVTLTRSSVPVICGIQAEAGGGPRPVVIPTTVDLEAFVPEPRARSAPLLAYAGSLGGWYLTGEMLDFGKVYLDTVERSRLLFLVNDLTSAALARLEGAARQRGIDMGRFEIASVPFDEVPERLKAASATFAFIRPTPSKTASAATKISESLALGLPFAVNPDVGDSAAVVRSEGVGVVVDLDAPESWPEAAAELDRLSRVEDIGSRCRAVALRDHSLEEALGRYEQIYARAAAMAGTGRAGRDGPG